MNFMKYMLIFIVAIIFVNYYYLNTSNTHITPSNNSLEYHPVVKLNYTAIALNTTLIKILLTQMSKIMYFQF